MAFFLSAMQPFAFGTGKGGTLWWG